MGFTALDGLPMGTRPGQIDPGVVLYLMTEKGMSASNVQDFLYRDCGLKGLSGVSNDMRELLDSADPRAAFAIDYFVYRVGSQCRHAGRRLAGPRRLRVHRRHRRKFGSASAPASPSGSPGSASRSIRPRTPGTRGMISRSDSRIPVYVVPTDEELMIAQHTLSLLLNRQSPNPQT